MRVGLISGTFDPIHDGHIKIVDQAVSKLRLDEVWFLPEKKPRNKQNVTDYHHRVEMLNLATQNQPSTALAEVSQDSHSLETLEEITKNNHDFFLLFGTDVVARMQTWQNLAKLEKLARIVSIGRNGEKADILFNHPASSKTIREQVARGMVPEYLDEKVLKYIYEHKLYQA